MGNGKQYNALYPIFVLLFPWRCKIGDTVAGWFWVSEKSRHEWHRVTGQASSLNIHLCTHTLWITEKLLTDSISFVHCPSLAQPSYLRLWARKCFLFKWSHVHRCSQADCFIALNCGESEQEREAIVLNLYGSGFSLPTPLHHAWLLFVSLWWCTDKSYRELSSVDLMHCLLLI